MPRVSDLFEVKQGARTGQNKVFLLTKNQWNNLPKKESHYFRPAVINKAIHFGTLRDVAYLFYPEGDFKINNEMELSNVLPDYYENFLLPNKSNLGKIARG